MRFRASQVATAVGGELVGDDVWLDGATQDSRTVTPGCLFVPIVAERDGHEFIAAALDAGAGEGNVGDHECRIRKCRCRNI